MIRTIKIGDSEIPAELDENTYLFIKDAVDRHDRAMSDGVRALKDCKDSLKEAQDAHGVLQKAHDGLKKDNDAMKSKLDGYEDSSKDDDDDEEDEEEGADGKKGADSAAKIKVTALDRYKRSVQRNKTLKSQIPTADQMHASVAALAKVIGDAKTIVGDAVDPKGKSIAAIRSAVVAHVIAKDAALKPMVLPIVGDDVSKATEDKIATAFAVIVAAPRGQAATQRVALDAATDLGRRIAADSRSAPQNAGKPIRLSGHSAVTSASTETGGAA